jgi:cyanophycinase
MLRRTLAIAILLGSACAAQLAPLHAQGRLVIAGGGVSRDNAQLYQAVLDGRRGAGPICVIPTASADLNASRGSMESSVATFERHGGAGTAVGVLMSIDNPGSAHDDDVVSQLRRCSGFYFTGGVQSRTVRVFRPDGEATPALQALMQRFRDGALVGGSSAGAAIMSDPMIAGGSTTTALSRGVRRSTAAGDADDDGAAGGVSITDGIGFLPSAIVDQHFLARGRIGRLIAAVLGVDEFNLGFGVDEDTGLVVDGDTAFAVGASGVVIVDARDAQRSGRSATDVALHLMGVGDRYDIGTRRLDVGTGKLPLATTDATVAAPDDLFARWEFLHLLERFARSDQQQLTVPVDGGRIVLRKGADFLAAAAATGDGVEGAPPAFTVRGLRLDLWLP